jgi:hypothetical protein
MCGELYRLQGRLRAHTLLAFAVIAAGVASVLWPPTGRESSRWSSVRRGAAIGLVSGVAWTALLGHRADGSPWVWPALVVYATGFAAAGAVVGAVRHFPELDGLCAGFLTVAVLAGIVAPDVDLDLLLRWNRPMTVRECLGIVVGVDWDLGWLVVFGGSGLLWGPVIGGLHRLFRPAVNGEPEAPAERGRISPFRGILPS